MVDNLVKKVRNLMKLMIQTRQMFIFLQSHARHDLKSKSQSV